MLYSGADNLIIIIIFFLESPAAVAGLRLCHA